jgi:hypothetical protein
MAFSSPITHSINECADSTPARKRSESKPSAAALPLPERKNHTAISSSATSINVIVGVSKIVFWPLLLFYWAYAPVGFSRLARDRGCLCADNIIHCLQLLRADGTLEAVSV